MNILFWNLYNKQNSKSIKDLLQYRDVDIAIFCEYEKTNFSSITTNNETYELEEKKGGNHKIQAIYKKRFNLLLTREQSRYTIYVFDNGVEIVVIAGLHLKSNVNGNASYAHMATLRDLNLDIENAEKEYKTDKTILIGDFNANPFSPELTLPEGLDAVLFKDVISAKEVHKHDNKNYRRFYNPTLTMLSEEDKAYGSHYYSSGGDYLYWYTYDQVIVRKSLMDRINIIEFCKRVGDRSFVSKKGLPNKNMSDHLPLLVEVDI